MASRRKKKRTNQGYSGNPAESKPGRNRSEQIYESQESGCSHPIVFLLYIGITIIGVFFFLPSLFAVLPWYLGTPLVLLLIPIFPAIGDIVNGEVPFSPKAVSELYRGNFKALFLRLFITFLAILVAGFQLIGAIGGFVLLILGIVTLVWMFKFGIGLSIAGGLGPEDWKVFLPLLFGFAFGEFIWFKLYVWGEEVPAKRIMEFIATLGEDPKKRKNPENPGRRDKP